VSNNIKHLVCLAVSLPIAAIAAIAAFTPGRNSDSTTVTFLVQAGLSAVAVSSLCIALRSMRLCKGNRAAAVNSDQPPSVDNDPPPPYSEVVADSQFGNVQVECAIDMTRQPT
jgi:hypothetical protein